MAGAGSPLVALVGFKRSRWAWAGGMRVLALRDGTVRILGKKGRIDLEVAVHELTARLTRTRTVELRSGTGSVIVFGVLQLGRIPNELERIAVLEGGYDAELIGPVPTGFLGVYSPGNVTGQAKASRALADALHARGVGEG